MNDFLQDAIREGRLAEAEGCVANAVAVTPTPELLNAHGVLLYRLDRKRDAADRFDRAVESRLTFVEAQQNLATTLADLGDPRPRFRVTVITPTVGSEYVAKAIASVQEQTYPFLEHVIVVDGPEYEAKVVAKIPAHLKHPLRIFVLPVNTGANGFNGHRVYGSMPYLVHGRYVSFLDEDNWFDPDHIASLMAKVHEKGLSWAYALRRIVGLDGAAITDDDCESLGQWATWNNPDTHLVDVSCYVVRRDLAVASSPLWYRRYPDERCPDFSLCKYLLTEHPRCGTNGHPTVNYRVGRSPASVRAEFFLAGNEAMRKRYGTALPWRVTR